MTDSEKQSLKVRVKNNYEPVKVANVIIMV